MTTPAIPLTDGAMTEARLKQLEALGQAAGVSAVPELLTEVRRLHRLLAQERQRKADEDDNSGHRDGCHLAHVPLALASCACGLDTAEVLQRTQSDLTEAIEQRDVYRDRCQRLAAENADLEQRLSVAYENALAHVAETDRLRNALRSLIARVRSVGGYATPEEQEALWEAERLVTVQ